MGASEDERIGFRMGGQESYWDGMVARAHGL